MADSVTFFLSVNKSRIFKFGARHLIAARVATSISVVPLKLKPSVSFPPKFKSCRCRAASTQPFNVVNADVLAKVLHVPAQAKRSASMAQYSAWPATVVKYASLKGSTCVQHRRYTQ